MSHPPRRLLNLPSILLSGAGEMPNQQIWSKYRNGPGGLCVSRWPGRGAGVLVWVQWGREGRGGPVDSGLEAAWEVGLALGLPPAGRVL